MIDGIEIVQQIIMVSMVVDGGTINALLYISTISTTTVIQYTSMASNILYHLQKSKSDQRIASFNFIMMMYAETNIMFSSRPTTMSYHAQA